MPPIGLYSKNMAEAAAQGVHIIVFPRARTNPGLGNWDYQPSDEESRLADLAETIPGETTARLNEKAWCSRCT
jgi:predicted amidohydrolase